MKVENYLLIDHIIPKKEFFIGKYRKENVLERMNDLGLLNPHSRKEIDNIYLEINNANLFPLLSMLTTLSGPINRKFNLLFDRMNLDRTEKIDLQAKYGIHYDTFISEFPTGYHFILFVESENDSSLISELKTRALDEIGIGICDESDWSIIKVNLLKSRLEYQEWKNNKKTK